LLWQAPEPPAYRLLILAAVSQARTWSD